MKYQSQLDPKIMGPTPYILLLHFGVHLGLYLCIEWFDTVQFMDFSVILSSNLGIWFQNELEPLDTIKKCRHILNEWLAHLCNPQ